VCGQLLPGWRNVAVAGMVNLVAVTIMAGLTVSGVRLCVLRVGGSGRRCHHAAPLRQTPSRPCPARADGIIATG
jgi:hypothetical protein